jgi:glycosyltransferase involved in cell wall biosynthesis
MRVNNRLALLTISEALKDFWSKKGINNSRIYSLHDGFDEAINNVKDSKTEIRNKLIIKEGTIVITYIGSLYKDRGVERVFELAKLYPACQFFIAGGPDDRLKHLKGESKRIGIMNVKFLGHLDRSDVNDYLLSSDILLMLWSSKVPTINYCSPMKVFEYMSSGNLIVGDGFPTISEVLTDGVNAYLTVPESMEDLNEKIGLAISELPYTDKGLKAKKLAFEKYTWKIRASRLKRIITNQDIKETFNRKDN